MLCCGRCCCCYNEEEEEEEEEEEDDVHDNDNPKQYSTSMYLSCVAPNAHASWTHIARQFPYWAADQKWAALHREGGG